MRDALSSEVYDEVVLCLKLPLEHKIEDEALAEAIVTARKEKRLTDVKEIQERRALFNRHHPTLTLSESSSAMVDRLSAILVSLEIRYNVLAGQGSDEKCELCLVAIAKITDKRDVKRTIEKGPVSLLREDYVGANIEVADKVNEMLSADHVITITII